MSADGFVGFVHTFVSAIALFWRASTALESPTFAVITCPAPVVGSSVLTYAKQAVDPTSSKSLFLQTSSSTCFSAAVRSEEHTSELQSLMLISYAVFGWK